MVHGKWKAMAFAKNKKKQKKKKRKYKKKVVFFFFLLGIVMVLDYFTGGV